MLVGGGDWSWCGLARSGGGVCSCFGMLQARARGACTCVCACVCVCASLGLRPTSHVAFGHPCTPCGALAMRRQG